MTTAVVDEECEEEVLDEVGAGRSGPAKTLMIDASFRDIAPRLRLICELVV